MHDCSHFELFLKGNEKKMKESVEKIRFKFEHFRGPILPN